LLVGLTKYIVGSRIVSRRIIAYWIYFIRLVLLLPPKTFPWAVLLLLPKALLAWGWPKGELFWAAPKILVLGLLNIEKLYENLCIYHFTLSVQSI
jgi:hypothetical protein